MNNIGFIGLGVMGAPMANNLIEAGYTLFTSSHHKPAPEHLVAKGLKVVADPQEVAGIADLLILMLPDTKQVEEVLFGPNGFGEGLRNGCTVIDMSSISPTATKEYAAQVRALGGHYLDAPVSGGEVGAVNGTLSIMVGGEEEVFERVRPVLEIMGENLNLIGENGDGQTAKVANQIIVAATIQAVAEGLLYASKAGADPERVRQTLLGGFAGSKILELHGKRMIERTFQPGFRIRLHQKDLDLALSSAKILGVSLPATSLCQQLLNSRSAHGQSEMDHSALIQSLEVLANHTVA